jgi:hypothetical protein
MSGPWLGGDKGIMACRTAMEQHWRDALTSAQQDAWLAYWHLLPPSIWGLGVTYSELWRGNDDTNAPSDAHARRYTTTRRSALNQTRQPPETIYAWQQMPGVYRFNRDPLATPAAQTTTRPHIELDTTDRTNLQCTISVRTADSYQPPLFIYAGLKPRGAPTVKPANLRYVTKLDAWTPGDQVDMTLPVWTTFIVDNHATLQIAAFGIDNNNGLIAPPSTSTAQMVDE